MARPLRIEYEGAFYHVMNRGAGKRKIFPDSTGDRMLFKSSLRDAVSLWKTRLHAYSLMDNHYHLLIETPLANLSRFVRHVAGVYTQRFNRIHGTDGPLFRGRFKSILVQKEDYFLELLRYIHLNGTRAGRFASPRQDFQCSYSEYLGERPAASWLTTSFGLSFFGRAVNSARAQFEEFVQKGVPDSIGKMMDGNRWPAILGSQSFRQDVRAKLALDQSLDLETPQLKEIRQVKKGDPAEVINYVSQRNRISLEDLLKPYSKENGQARAEAMVLIRRVCHLTYAQIGELMGGIQDSGVERAIKKLESTKGSQIKILVEKWGLSAAVKEWKVET